DAVAEALERGRLEREVARCVQPAEAVRDGVADVELVAPQGRVAVEQAGGPLVVRGPRGELVEAALDRRRELQVDSRAHQAPPSMVARSIARTLSRRRRWRDSPLNEAARKASEHSSAGSAPMTRAPRVSTFMSSCSTPWWAEYVSWQTAERTPRILFAATLAPTPE